MVEDREGKEVKWLNYSYEGFPLISSLAKFTMMQNDIRLTEADVLTTLLGKELELESGVTESKYISLLKTENGADIDGYIKKTHGSKSKLAPDFLFSKSKEEKRPKENGNPETVVNKEKEFIA